MRRNSRAVMHRISCGRAPRRSSLSRQPHLTPPCRRGISVSQLATPAATKANPSSAAPSLSRRAQCASGSRFLRPLLPEHSWQAPCHPLHSPKPSSRSDLPSTSSTRSEEHTSELQSRLHLVCRLLLEKKKTLLFIDAHPCTAKP